MILPFALPSKTTVLALSVVGLVLTGCYLTYSYVATKSELELMKSSYSELSDKHNKLLISQEKLLKDIKEKSDKIKELSDAFSRSKSKSQARSDAVANVLKTPVTEGNVLELENQINNNFSELQRGVECLTGKQDGCQAQSQSYHW